MAGFDFDDFEPEKSVKIGDPIIEESNESMSKKLKHIKIIEEKDLKLIEMDIVCGHRFYISKK